MGINRHLSRIVVLQTLYEWDFRQEKEAIDPILRRNFNEFFGDVDEIYVNKVVSGVITKAQELDEIIIKAAPDWPIDQVAKIDKALLRISIYEMLFDTSNEVPAKVAINEAVELGKQFGSENSSKFINGVLGTVYKDNEKELNLKENI